MNNIFDKIAETAAQRATSFFGEADVSSVSALETTNSSSGLAVAMSVLSVFFITVIIYSLVRIYEIRRDEKKEMHLADLI